MRTIGIASEWNYDRVIVLPQMDDESLAELQKLIQSVGTFAYEQGYNEGFNDKESRCTGCAFEDVNEWEMPCSKCKRACKDYWRKKA